MRKTFEIKKRSRGIRLFMALVLVMTLLGGIFPATSVADPGPLSVVYNGVNETSGIYLYNIQVDSESPIQNPVIEIKATGSASDKMVLEAASKTYLESKGFTVSGSSMGGGYVLSSSYPFSKITIENLKFAYDGILTGGTTDNPTFTLKDSSTVLGEYTHEKTFTAWVTEKFDSMKGTITAPTTSITMPDPTPPNQTISYNFHFELWDDVFELNGAGIPGNLAGSGIYQPSTAFHANIIFPGTFGDNPYGNDALADVLGTATFSNLSGCQITWYSFQDVGGVLYLSIAGTMDEVSNTQKGVFDAAITINAKDLQPGRIPSPEINMYGDHGTGLVYSKRQLRQENGAIMVRSLDPEVTKKNFTKKPIQDYTKTVRADLLLGDGADITFNFTGKDGILGNSNTTNLGDLFYVDEIENSTTPQPGDPGGIAPWTSTGYSSFYFGREGIKTLNSGAFDDGSGSPYAVDLYARVKARAGGYLAPVPAQLPSAAFQMYGNGNYWPVAQGTTSGATLDKIQILNAFGITSNYDDYIVDGAIWDFSSQGTREIPVNMHHTALPSITMHARVEDPTNPTVIARVHDDMNSGNQYLVNSAKIQYRPASTSPGPGAYIRGSQEGKTGTKEFAPSDYLGAGLWKFVSFADESVTPPTFSDWTAEDGADHRNNSAAYWWIQLYNDKDSKLNYKSTDDGKIIIQDYFPQSAVYRSQQFKAYLVTDLDTWINRFEADGNKHARYDEDYTQYGCTDISAYVHTQLNEERYGINYTVDLMKMPQGERTADIAKYFDFSTGGLKPDGRIILMYKTDLKDATTLPTGLHLNGVVSPSVDPIKETVNEELTNESNDLWDFAGPTDLNGNGTTDDDVMWSNAKFYVGPRPTNTEITSLYANKQVAKKTSATASASDYEKVQIGLEAGETYSYKLTVETGPYDSAQNLIIRDVLPAQNDTMILNPLRVRGSDWEPALASHELLGTLKLTLNGTEVPVTTDGAGGSWVLGITTNDGTPDTNVREFTITPPAGTDLEPGQRLIATYDVKVPETARTTGLQSVNSFVALATVGSQNYALESSAKVEVTAPTKTSLTVDKTITGLGADPEQEFQFTLETTSTSAGPFEYLKSDTTSGTISSGDTFTLKHGQNIVINGVAIGDTYAVTESTATVDYTAAQQTIADTAVDGGITASFVNAYEAPPAPTEESTFIKMPERTQVAAGETVDYTFSGFGNTLDHAITDVSITDFPPQELAFVSGKIPAFTKGEGLTYSIKYDTNQRKGVVHASGISASQPYDLAAPSLQSGEYFTAIVVAFDTVPSGFGVGDTITMTFRAPATPSDTSLVNKASLSFNDEGDEVVVVSPKTPIKVENPNKDPNSNVDTGDSRVSTWGLFALALCALATVTLTRKEGPVRTSLREEKPLDE